MNDFQFRKKGWVIWANTINHTIVIDDVLAWLEEFITMSITHETIHEIIENLEGVEVSVEFDNIFGYADPSILLCLEENNEFYSTQEQRLEEWWTRKEAKNQVAKLMNPMK